MEYQTIKENTCEIVIEHSKFIGYSKGVESAEEAREFLAQIRKKHSDATHNCYAYKLLDGSAKFSDDGEPSGTAGAPILEAITSENLTNVIVVVTRYFGGIKLGTGGLVRAYFQTGKSALATKKIKYEFCDVYTLCLNYDELHKVDSFLQNNYSVLSKDFDMDIKVTFAVKKGEEVESKLAELLNKKPAISWLKDGFMPI